MLVARLFFGSEWLPRFGGGQKSLWNFSRIFTPEAGSPVVQSPTWDDFIISFFSKRSQFQGPPYRWIPIPSHSQPFLPFCNPDHQQARPLTPHFLVIGRGAEAGQSPRWKCHFFHAAFLAVSSRGEATLSYIITVIMCSGRV